MTKRSINTSIEERLVSNEPFEYAHLIKFERPFNVDPDVDKLYRTNANRYAYYTDAARDISFNDASTDHTGASNGSQIYRANRIESIGGYAETTAPRATNMSLKLSGNHLGTSVSVTGDFSSAAFTVDSKNRCKGNFMLLFKNELQILPRTSMKSARVKLDLLLLLSLNIIEDLNVSFTWLTTFMHPLGLWTCYSSCN